MTDIVSVESISKYAQDDNMKSIKNAFRLILFGHLEEKTAKHQRNETIRSLTKLLVSTRSPECSYSFLRYMRQ